jgi:tetratricopeptide (TPR) repeat protein
VPSGVTGGVIVLAAGSGSGSGAPPGHEAAVAFRIQEAIAGFNRSLCEASVGLLAIDVLDQDGAVIARVEPGGSAAGAGLAAGDVITQVNRQPVANGSAFAAILAAQAAGTSVELSVRTRTGSTRTVTLPVVALPRAISMLDQTVLFNKLLADHRGRLAQAPAGTEEPVLRLHIAVCLMALGNYTEARRELERVELPKGGGVSHATVQYLLGLCAEHDARIDEAERLWKAAAAEPDALLTEDGPPIRDLVEQKLAALRRPGR